MTNKIKFTVTNVTGVWPCGNGSSDANFEVSWENLSTGETGTDIQGVTNCPNDMIPSVGNTWTEDE